ncbi:MAG: carboxypeptidase-like regulatory domain-containing protein [Lutibacter sp.]|jgi:hypothetical protein
MKLRSKNIFVSIAFLVFVYSNLLAQKSIVKLEGTVRSDSTFLEYINILNLTSNIGTSSNEKGNYTIYASIGDTIQFSSINYKQRIIKISKSHIENKTMTVYLEQAVNELDEVEIRQSFQPNWGKLSLPKGAIFDNDNITSNKAPNTKKFTDPTYGNTGVDLAGIGISLINKIFQSRKARKEEERHLKKEKQLFIDQVIENVGTDFFTAHLNIKEEEIYLFLYYCEDNGLGNFYNSDEFLMKDFLIKQSKKYNQTKE